MLNAIRDSLSNIAGYDDKHDREGADDDEQDTDLGKLSDRDEPGWVMGTIFKLVPHTMESIRQKQMRIDEITQVGWGDAPDYFREREMNYATAKLRVPAVVKPQIDTTAATPSPTTVGEHFQNHDIVRE
jgi:hypothetical protein